MGTGHECRHLCQWIQGPACVCTVKEEAKSKGERLTVLDVYVFFSNSDYLPETRYVRVY